jgi:hypothetical protein
MARFAYYNRLGQRQKEIYRKSDSLTQVLLPDKAAVRAEVERLREALPREDRREIQAHCRRIVAVLVEQLAAPPVRVDVLAVRPSQDWGELHGLYTLEPERSRAQIQLWMRTAKQRRVVAFRTFVRTLLHELCHHLDFTVYGWAESFHTQGFFQRETSLARQLLEPEPRGPRQEALWE